MSEANVEVVRRTYENLQRGDVQGALAHFDPDIEVHTARDGSKIRGPDYRPVYYGPGGFLQFLGQLSEAWEEFAWVPDELIDVDDERVLVLVRLVARGRKSRIEVEQPMAQLCTLRTGKIVRHKTYWDIGEAREEAGLE